MRSKFSVTGMSCAACSARIEKVVGRLEGIKSVQVNLATAVMVADYENITEADIIAAVKKAGFGAEIYSREKMQNKKDVYNSFKRRLIVSFACLIPLLYLSMGGMLGLPVFPIGINSVLQLLLTVPVIAVNFTYYKSGYKKLFLGAPNMDTLIALGSSASVIYGIYSTVRLFSGAQSVSFYYESAAMILTLITLGKYFETRSKGRAGAVIEKMRLLAPDTVTLKKDNSEISIAAELLLPGDIVCVRAGERLAADGVIISGTGSADQSAVTGESIPADKKAGDTVIGGTVLKSGYIEFEVTKTGENSLLGEIIKMVEESAGSKVPLARIADKVSGVFVPTVLVISLITFIIWMFISKNTATALNFAVSVLVISCPCALGLATPVAVMVATGVAAKFGILFKNGEALETASKIDTVVLDKTGTVTSGELTVKSVKAFIPETELLELAFNVEKLSAHPIAKCITEYCKAHNAAELPAQNAETFAGMGVCAEISGKKVYAGNRRLCFEHGIETENKSDSLTEVLFFTDKLLGIIEVGDTVRSTSKAAVAKLKQENINVYMISGDTENSVNMAAKAVGITNIISNALPQEKAQKIAELKSKGKTVAMVGDGINDAVALTEADIGIAVGGTDIANESADVILVSSDLLSTVTLINLSRKVVKNIKVNLFWAFFYNAISIPVAAGALFALGIQLTPAIAAAAMSLSSVCVVSNALRLNRFKGEK